MSSFQIPPITGVPALSTVERAAVLDALFEPCTALHTLSLDLLHTETFESYNDLIASVGVQLTDLSESSSTSDTEWLDKILGAHPRLGEKKVESAQSQAEQAQLNTGGVEEATKLRNLNEEYERKFPGLKYVVFVNGRSRPVIMDNMKERIARGDVRLERAEAIKHSYNSFFWWLRRRIWQGLGFDTIYRVKIVIIVSITRDRIHDVEVGIDTRHSVGSIFMAVFVGIHIVLHVKSIVV
ncbi:putative allantoinase [Lachnellula hyalina]|uniref:Putative allantoinase n=1 Tax=Lachnellula hyalina TaxID=1316788 RepID=A0A8H8U0X2_9HELO|nr:putative allantoinase [Lachnellula hyalina]TVY29413.1 putative allantoinase [Lachnellula hyalina]